MDLNQLTLNYYIMQTSDLDITWLLPGISILGTQDRSSLGTLNKASHAKFVSCGTEHHPLVMCVATPPH